jgi:hypothetical protein
MEKGNGGKLCVQSKGSSLDYFEKDDKDDDEQR